MTANPILLQKKYARVIECFASNMSISLDDVHCMSDEYLAEELKVEYNANKLKTQR